MEIELISYACMKALRKFLEKRVNGTVRKGARDREFICSGVSRESADQLEFEKDGKKISVARYYEKEHGIVRFVYARCVGGFDILL